MPSELATGPGAWNAGPTVPGLTVTTLGGGSARQLGRTTKTLRLSSDSASAAVVSSSLGSTSAVSQSASSAEVSFSSDFVSVGASSSRAC